MCTLMGHFFYPVFKLQLVVLKIPCCKNIRMKMKVSVSQLYLLTLRNEEQIKRKRKISGTTRRIMEVVSHTW